MPPTLSTSSASESNRLSFWKAALVLAAVLMLIFHQSLAPGMTIFSNDGPLGAISAASGKLPEGFVGVWNDLNWLGGRGIGASPNVSSVLAWITGPVLFSKIYPPLALLVLGLCTWFFLRQLGFKPAVCLLVALASVLNMDVFSTATWGLPAWSLARAMIFLALAALVTKATDCPWLKAALGGLAVGMGVMEGFDVGAIYSLYVAAFVLFQTFVESDTPALKAAKAAARIAIVVVFAVLIAAQSLTALIGTQIKGIAGMEQDQETKQIRWDQATQWSLPKIETLRVLIPGLFGYRIDPPDNSNYWGAVGRQPGWEQHHQGLPRHSGSGEYAGVLVVLLAAWSVIQSLRREQSPFDAVQRKFVWFWGAAALISLLLAYGRHAPFYQFIYALPYFSTIRNPIKFMQPFQLALLILSAYGLQDLARCYWTNGTAQTQSLNAHLKSWWRSAPAFEKKWVQGTTVLLVVSVLGWLMYGSSRRELEKHLTETAIDAALAPGIARFSLMEVGLFIVFLALSAGLIALALSGFFRGPRATFGCVLMGGVLVVDLGRANAPWVVYYNYRDKYASNPIIEVLRDRSYERRVAVLPFPGIPELTMFHSLYHGVWMQHHFPYYNIQSLEMVQEPRMPQEKIDFTNAFTNAPLRYWELTGARYLFGLTALVDPLNQQMDAEKRRFKLHTAFSIHAEKADGPIIFQTNAVGPFALIEFTGALPRAQLYSRWEVSTNERVTLQRLASPAFDPASTLLVADPVPVPAGAVSTNQTAGSVAFESYSPKRIQLRSKAGTDTLLLLNDRYDPAWKVWVDSNPAPLLRCNFIMRGVHLPPGEHTIEFRFVPPITGFYISLAAVLLGLALSGWVAVSSQAKTQAAGEGSPNSVSPARAARDRPSPIANPKSE